MPKSQTHLKPAEFPNTKGFRANSEKWDICKTCLNYLLKLIYYHDCRKTASYKFMNL